MDYRLYYDEDYPDKLKQLLEVSDPKEVIMKAIDYFNDPIIKVYLSTKKIKKYMVLHPNTKTFISFGDLRYEDFTKHKNLEEQHI